MKTFLLVIQLIIAITLLTLILMQNSKGGLTSSMGGMDFYRTKRGAEKIVFTATIIFSILFFVITILNMLVR